MVDYLFFSIWYWFYAEHDFDKAKKILSWFYHIFEKLSLKWVFCVGGAQDEDTMYADLFGYRVSQFPTSYLDISIHYRRLTNAEWKHVEERLQKRLASWKGKLLSFGGRLVLINSVFSNMILYMISFLQFFKWVLQRLDYSRSRFFWERDSEKKKYWLAKWNVVLKVHGALMCDFYN
jgi:hypothetical protein